MKRAAEEAVEQYVWVRVEGALQADEYKVTGLRNVSRLLSEVYKSAKERLEALHVSADLLRLYVNKAAQDRGEEPLNKGLSITDLLKRGEFSEADPGFVDYNAPRREIAQVMTNAEKLRNTACEAAELAELAGRVRFPESVHAEPGSNSPFVQRPREAKEFLDILKVMVVSMKRDRQLDKGGSPLLEYSTMSGAGKSRWGFEVERLLKAEYKDASVRRVGLNFNGGTGAGSADKTMAEFWASPDLRIGLDSIMSALLLSRGLLRTSPERLHGLEDWVMQLSVKEVINAIFMQMGTAEGDDKFKILVVHVDELALLLLPGDDRDRMLKVFMNTLADYNCSPEAMGLVVPIITHTAPVLWEPIPTVIPLKALTLRPMTFEESTNFFKELSFVVTARLETRRLVSACGGHPKMLTQLRVAMTRSATLSTLCSLDVVQSHRESIVTNVDKTTCRDLVRIILRQDFVEVGDYVPLMKRGLVCLEFTAEQTRKRCRMSVPYPMMVNILLHVDPSRYDDLEPPSVPVLSHKWSADAFEKLCAVRMAADFGDTLPFEGRPSNMTICDLAKKFKTDGRSGAYLCPENHAGVDSVGFHGSCMTVIQSKYSEKDGVEQTPEEVQKFIKFVLRHAVGWALTAGCTELHAIFATDRKAPNFHACPLPSVQPAGIQLTFTMYANNVNNPKAGQVQSECIAGWLPPGVMCV